VSAYDPDDERAIRTGRLVEDWTKSGLLTPAQRAVVMPQLDVDLRRTNKFLRLTLFVFAAIILQSAIGLIAVQIGADLDQTTAALLCMAIGGGCFWLATHLVRRYHLYRFGVEEAVALSAAALTTAGAALLVDNGGNWPVVTGLVIASVTGSALFRHFGFVYAAVIAMAAAAALPFQFSSTALGASGAEIVQRVAAVLILAGVAGAVRIARASHGSEYPGDVLTVIEAAAWVGIYLLVNLVASSGVAPLDRGSAFHWLTYAAIWLLPAAGLWLSIRGRERPLLAVSIAMAIATLLSNKEYLGWPRYEWDPIVFGLLLMGIAIGVRRWLAAGHGGMRHGYTASRLVVSDQAALGGLAMVSTVHTEVPVTASAPPPDPAIGGGGRSGGGGAGGSF